jgi:hypothetical protein
MIYDASINSETASVTSGEASALVSPADVIDAVADDVEVCNAVSGSVSALVAFRNRII